MKMPGTVITAVERHPKQAGRYLIYLDGEPAITVHEDVLIKHRLLKGERIDAERLKQAVADEEQQRAWSDALKQVGRRPRSEKEVRHYLRRKGYAPPLIDAVVDRLKRDRYLDDAEFAAQWTEQRIYSQKKGRGWVKRELQQKGVSSTVIRRTLDRIPAEEEERLAFETGVKKWNASTGSMPDKKRKTAAFLLRRGYASAIVGKVIRRIAEQYPVSSDVDADDENGWFDD